MADYEKVSNVAASSIEKVNNIAKSSVEKINGMTTPSGTTTATYWAIAQDDRRISHATNADVLAGNAWTSYDAFSGASGTTPSGGNDHIHIAYGKDAADGDPRWVASYATNNCELAYTDNLTGGGNWTGINTDSGGSNLPNRVFALQWGNGHWIAVGKMGTKSILQSADGASWTQIDLSGDGTITSTDIYALASNGSGTWWFAQENRIYQSTSDGDAGSWSLLHTLLDSSNADPGNIRALQYTNNTLMAGVDANPALVFTAAVSDLTDWSNETSLTSGGNAFDQQTHVASAAGRVVVVGSQFKWTFDISGKTITMDENQADFSGDNTTHGTLTSVSTDGSTWVATCFTGDTFYSTDGGDTWNAGPTNVASKDALDNAPDVYLPL
tara:strand:+ start:1413 stop:2564 length:1152 start_codon:yes stop_codon:yes gene_type:complete